MYLNKVFIVGNLTRDPELKSLPSGSKVCNFSLATNSYWKDAKTGESKEATEFHNIIVFGRQAETIAQYLRKGSSALVEGRLQTRTWDDKDGKKNYRTEINADRVQFGNSKGTGTGATGGSRSDDQSAGDDAAAQASQIDVIDYPEDSINPEDIPF